MEGLGWEISERYDHLGTMICECTLVYGKASAVRVAMCVKRDLTCPLVRKGWQREGKKFQNILRRCSGVDEAL